MPAVRMAHRDARCTDGHRLTQPRTRGCRGGHPSHSGEVAHGPSAGGGLEPCHPTLEGSPASVVKAVNRAHGPTRAVGDFPRGKSDQVPQGHHLVVLLGKRCHVTRKLFD
jgi:hypothetical protein